MQRSSGRRARVNFVLKGPYNGKPSVDHWADELAEYNKGIGYFQRRDDDDYKSESDDEPDVRPPEHPYRNMLSTSEGAAP